ncbi:MAG TPA: hypothetical protein VGG72_28555 [Bryobacteraceae bacterium]|jgi:hypothetical protein
MFDATLEVQCRLPCDEVQEASFERHRAFERDKQEYELVLEPKEVPGVRSHGKSPGKLLVPERVRVFAEGCKRFDNADHLG